MSLVADNAVHATCHGWASPECVGRYGTSTTDRTEEEAALTTVTQRVIQPTRWSSTFRVSFKPNPNRRHTRGKRGHLNLSEKSDVHAASRAGERKGRLKASRSAARAKLLKGGHAHVKPITRSERLERVSAPDRPFYLVKERSLRDAQQLQVRLAARDRARAMPRDERGQQLSKREIRRRAKEQQAAAKWWNEREEEPRVRMKTRASDVLSRFKRTGRVDIDLRTYTAMCDGPAAPSPSNSVWKRIHRLLLVREGVEPNPGPEPLYRFSTSIAVQRCINLLPNRWKFHYNRSELIRRWRIQDALVRDSPVPVGPCPVTVTAVLRVLCYLQNTVTRSDQVGPRRHTSVSDIAFTRAEVTLLLQRAGIHPNPGPQKIKPEDCDAYSKAIKPLDVEYSEQVTATGTRVWCKLCHAPLYQEGDHFKHPTSKAIDAVEALFPDDTQGAATSASARKPLKITRPKPKVPEPVPAVVFEASTKPAQSEFKPTLIVPPQPPPVPSTSPDSSSEDEDDSDQEEVLSGHFGRGKDFTKADARKIFHSVARPVGPVCCRHFLVPYRGERRLLTSRNVEETKQGFYITALDAWAVSRAWPLLVGVLLCLPVIHVLTYPLLSVETVGYREIVAVARGACPTSTWRPGWLANQWHWAPGFDVSVSHHSAGLFAIPVCLVIIALSLLFTLQRKSIWFVPHLVSCVVADFDRGLNLTVIRTNMRSKFRRISSFPLPDEIHLRVIAGSEQVVEYLLKNDQFFTQAAVAPEWILTPPA